MNEKAEAVMSDFSDEQKRFIIKTFNEVINLPIVQTLADFLREVRARFEPADLILSKEDVLISAKYFRVWKDQGFVYRPEGTPCKN